MITGKEKYWFKPEHRDHFLYLTQDRNQKKVGNYWINVTSQIHIYYIRQLIKLFLLPGDLAPLPGPQTRCFSQKLQTDPSRSLQKYPGLHSHTALLSLEHCLAYCMLSAKREGKINSIKRGSLSILDTGMSYQCWTCYVCFLLSHLFISKILYWWRENRTAV